MRLVLPSDEVLLGLFLVLGLELGEVVDLGQQENLVGSQDLSVFAPEVVLYGLAESLSEVGCVVRETAHQHSVV